MHCSALFGVALAFGLPPLVSGPQVKGAERSMLPNQVESLASRMVDAEGPSVAVEGLSADVGASSGDFEVPSADAGMPSEAAEAPPNDVDAPPSEAPPSDAEASKEEAPPSDAPSSEAGAPSGEAEAPSGEAEAPSSDVDAPPSDAQAPSSDVDAPPSDAPSDAPPSTDVVSPGQSSEAQGGSDAHSGAPHSAAGAPAAPGSATDAQRAADAKRAADAQRAADAESTSGSQTGAPAANASANAASLATAEVPAAAKSGSPTTRDAASDALETSPSGPGWPQVSIEPGVGAWFRLGGDSTEFDSRNIFGIRYGVAAWYAPEDLYSVGLAFETAGLGGGQRAEGLDSIDIEYGVSTVWAGARAYPFRRGPLALFVLLRVGASFQRLDANGIRATSNITVPAETFQCSAGQGPGFALGGSVGVDVTLNEQIAFLGQVDAAAHRLSSDVIDGCARGVGSVSSLGFGLGLAYRFGIGH